MKIRITTLFLIIGLCTATEIGRSQQPTAPTSKEGTLPPVSKFQGSAQFTGKDGRPRTANVAIRLWTIPPKQKLEALAERGFLLVTLRAGKVTTTINGQQQQRRTDDFWAVPENLTMSVESSGESALLEVVSLREQ